MCGIAGVIRIDGAPVNQGEVCRMVGSLKHRGPDGTGLYAWDSSGSL